MDLVSLFWICVKCYANVVFEVNICFITTEFFRDLLHVLIPLTEYGTFQFNLMIECFLCYP